MRITKKHVGRPVDFKASNGTTINGVIELVKNGMAMVRYWLVRDEQGEQIAHTTEGFTAYLNARNDARLVEVY